MATSRKIALLFAAENINAIIGWVALLFVARKMGASALGEFGYALSLVGGFTFLAFFGFRMAHVKRVSEGLDLGKCIGTFLSVRLVLISFMLMVFASCYWFWTVYLDKQIYDIQTPGLLLTIVLYYIVFLALGVMTATFSGLQQCQSCNSKYYRNIPSFISFHSHGIDGLGSNLARPFLSRGYHSNITSISLVFPGLPNIQAR